MALHSLLVSRDMEAVAVLQGVMSDLHFDAEVCNDLQGAIERLVCDKLDAVVVDYDEVEHATELLRLLRLNSGRKSIALAMVRGVASMQAALDTGANFVMVKPLSLECAARSLRAVKGLLQRMARRSARLIVHTLAYVSMDGMRDRGIILDISEGGMAIQALELVDASRALHLAFELPGWNNQIEATGEIAWADASGRAGVRFVQISDTAQKQLKDWILTYAMSALAEPMAPKRENLPAVAPRASLASISLDPRAAESDAGPQAAARSAVLPPDSTPFRVASALVDGGLVLLANVLFCLVFLLFSSTIPDSPWALVVGLMVPALFWAGYHYLFLAHPRGTPGMQMAQLGNAVGEDIKDEYELGPFGRERTLAVASARLLAWLNRHTGSPLRRLPSPWRMARVTQLGLDSAPAEPVPPAVLPS